jgi:carbon storage regulator CsrA
VLVLARKANQVVTIRDSADQLITVKVLKTTPGRVTLGFGADKSIRVCRGEQYPSVASNQTAHPPQVTAIGLPSECRNRTTPSNRTAECHRQNTRGRSLGDTGRSEQLEENTCRSELCWDVQPSNGRDVATVELPLPA